MIGLSIGIRKARAGTAAAASPAAFAMSQLTQPSRIYQRGTTSGGGQGKGQGVVPVALAAVTNGGTLYARCSSGGATRGDLQPAWAAASLTATGAQTVTIAGVDARLGFFYLDLSGDGVTWANGTTPIGMGALVLCAGQSLMVRMFTRYAGESATTIAGAGASIPASGRVFAASDTQANAIGSGASQIPTAWVSLADATANRAWSSALNGAGAAELMTRLIGIAGVNVGLVAKAEGATAIADWQAGQALGDALTATMDAAGGRFESMIWYQGHTDSGNGRSAGYYNAQLDTLFANLANHNSFAAPRRLVASIPNITNGWGTVAAKEAIRRASYEWAVANGAVPVQMNDINLPFDGVHPDPIGAVRQGDHFYRALRPAYGAARDDKGATFGTPTHASGSANIVIPFTLPSGATGLTGSGTPEVKFKIYKRGLRSGALGFTTSAPFAIDNGARTITLKLAVDPGQIPLDVLPFGTDDPSDNSMIYDDVTDGDGLAFGRQVHPGAAALHVAVSHDLAINSGAYGAGKFGSTLTAGYGITSTSVMPALAEGWRLEAWVRVDTPENAIRVFCGQGNAAWIGCQNNDLKMAIGSGAAPIQTFAGVLPTGVWTHVAITCDAPGLTCTVHLNGVQQGSSFATTSDYADTLNVFAVRGFGGAIGSFDLTTQSVDEVAIWRSAWPAAVMPSSPYGGTEAGLLALWHLNSGANSAVA